MRSGGEPQRLGQLVGWSTGRKFALALLLAASLLLATHISSAQQQAPTEEQVAQALEQLRNDPNLHGERTTRVLRWKNNVERKAPETNWLIEFFKWIAQTGRVLMWVVIGGILLLVVYAIVRQVRGYERIRRPEKLLAPTHVRDLDIRPESLPDDIGGTALHLWRQGERRSALALLYRGLLSRLVHAHAVPIKSSSTEGECVQLARAQLTQPTSEYVSHLVRTWQQAVYGARDPDDEEVARLCNGFDTALRQARPS